MPEEAHQEMISGCWLPPPSPTRGSALIVEFSLREKLSLCPPPDPEPWLRDYAWEEKQVIKQKPLNQFPKMLTSFKVEHGEVQA